MPDFKPLADRLLKHAATLRATEQSAGWKEFASYPSIAVSVSGSGWLEFLKIDGTGDAPFARLYAAEDALARHQAHHPGIRPSKYVPRDGHIAIDAPLDGTVPAERLLAMVDDAWRIAWNKLDANDRLLVELGEQPYDEANLLDQLIDHHQLNSRRKQVRKLVRTAVLLKSKKTADSKIPLGATKIGGRPDLSKETTWPSYSDGKPLAFLAQIDLAEIAKLGTPVMGLPKSGLMSLFSVWGWMEEDDGDPQVPDDRTMSRQEECGWSVILHTSMGAALERRKPPRGVNSFPGGAVEATPILSLPAHADEPAVAALDWDDEELERLDELQMDFRLLQGRHHAVGEDGNSGSGRHILGGYATFQQQFPDDLDEKGLAMLMELGFDGDLGMSWGDGGELTFYVDAKALAKGRFERVWAECQGG